MQSIDLDDLASVRGGMAGEILNGVASIIGAIKSRRAAPPQGGPPQGGPPQGGGPGAPAGVGAGCPCCSSGAGNDVGTSVQVSTGAPIQR
jgi:hypothetical protein